MREFWEQRYSEEEYAYGTEPNAFLVAAADRLAPGSKALMVGDGQGRNGVWLAEQGLRVTSVDFARAGLERTQELARQRGVSVETQHEDLLHWDWPKAAFDAVVAIFVHFGPENRARVHREMINSVKPGGWIILEGFEKSQLGRVSGGPPVADVLYTEHDLAEDFADTEIELLETREVELDEGRYHRGKAMVVRLVARKG